MQIDLHRFIDSRVFFLSNNNELLHSVAFFSKNLNLAGYNYKMEKKKSLTIIKYFE